MDTLTQTTQAAKPNGYLLVSASRHFCAAFYFSDYSLLRELSCPLPHDAILSWFSFSLVKEISSYA